MRILTFIPITVFALFLACNRHQEYNYPDADAVYLNLTKTFVLNKDGSMVSTVEKKQKLLTYRSFQSLYGETRIDYNPEFQKLVINEASTVNPQNRTIKTPENGFNQILPAFCEDSKAYSHLREMVVTHTGLERNAVINCAYTITTSAGKIPFLMGFEELQSDCPIEQMNIVVKVPSGTALHFKVLNTSVTPEVDKGSEYDSYSWKLKDIPQRIKEFRSGLVFSDIPALLFSTQENMQTGINFLLAQKAFSFFVNDEIKSYIDLAIKDKKTIPEKVLKIQEVVVNELKSLYIPSQLVGFQVRTPAEVWQSNSGTITEKACLLTSMLRAEGISAEVVLGLPDCIGVEPLPVLLASEPIVKVSTQNGEVMLLSPDRINLGNFDATGSQSTIIALNTNQKGFKNQSSGSISVEGDITIDPHEMLKGELNGTFTELFNPYFEIIRNQGKCPLLLTDFAGTLGKFSANQTDVHFKVDKGDELTKRGDLRFLQLKEAKTGLASMHLIAMPFTRKTELNLGTSIRESYHVSYKLPDGYKLLNPVNIDLAKPGIGNLTVILNQSGNIVEVTRKIYIAVPTVKPELYLAFKELIDSWNTTKYRQLILKKG